MKQLKKSTLKKDITFSHPLKCPCNMICSNAKPGDY